MAWNPCHQSLIEWFNAHCMHRNIYSQAPGWETWTRSSHHPLQRWLGSQESKILFYLGWCIHYPWRRVSLCCVNQGSDSIASVTSPWKNSECHIYLQREQREAHPVDRWCFVDNHSKQPLQKKPQPPKDNEKQKPSESNTTFLWLLASAAGFIEHRIFLHMTYFENTIQLFLCKNDEARKWLPIVFWLSSWLDELLLSIKPTKWDLTNEDDCPSNFLECFTCVRDEGILAIASNSCQRIISFLLICC